MWPRAIRPLQRALAMPEEQPGDEIPCGWGCGRWSAGVKGCRTPARARGKAAPGTDLRAGDRRCPRAGARGRSRLRRLNRVPAAGYRKRHAAGCNAKLQPEWRCTPCRCEAVEAKVHPQAENRSTPCEQPRTCRRPGGSRPSVSVLENVAAGARGGALPRFGWNSVSDGGPNRLLPTIRAAPLARMLHQAR